MGVKISFGASCGIDDVPLLAECGYDFWECPVASALVANADGENWAARRKVVLSTPIPLRACNCFLPNEFRLIGPDASFDAALDYATMVCRRADEVGVETIAFGSSAVRRIPAGFSREQGLGQFTEFCKRLADGIADCKVCVLLEALCHKEDNLLNYVSDCARIEREIDSPRIKLLADFFHMSEGGEGPESIVSAGNAILHCHVAEPGTRGAPGTSGGDSSPYFSALRKIAYTGGVSCECGWPADSGKKAEYFRKALATLERWSSCQ